MTVSLKSKKHSFISMLSGFGLALSAGFSVSVAADSGFVQNALLPADADPTCTQNISSWFVGNRVTANGWVEPANGFNPIFADSAHNTKCDFYKWGAQMFLWLTSETGKGHVFNTAPTFYNVSVQGTDGKRTFIAQNGAMNLALRDGKDDQIELGQATDSSVLVSQNGSLVYYGVHANDVFAVYLTGQKNGAFANDGNLNLQFPDTAPETFDVVDYGQTIGYDIPSENAWAMAMELKTSWVEASTVSDQSKFVLTQAIVPTFNRSNPTNWTVNGTVEKTLALVGMHVVGTVDGHPEMIWATFEHVDNAPNAAYVYNTTGGKTATQAYNSDVREWLFMPKGGSEPSTITSNAKANNESGSTIVSSISCTTNCANAPDVANLNPWGSQPAPSSAGAANNADLISINTSVLEQLQAGDIRGNYVQTGSIWTSNGSIPGATTPKGTDPNLTGSLFISNTTMETFFQYPDQASNQPRNCFGCHNTGSGNPGYKISHIYTALQQLTPKN